MQKTIETFFENPIVRALRGKDFVASKEFSETQKVAVSKAIMYIISADGVVTDSEKNLFFQLCADLNVDGNIMKEAEAMSDDDMFNALKTVSEEQEAYILSYLNNAANSDNELAEEEIKIINTFTLNIKNGEKPKEFYAKILTF